MEDKMYSYSKYSFFVENNGWIILYNSLYGIDSLCKIPKEVFSSVIEQHANQFYVDELMKHHHLVHEEDNEESLLEYKRNKMRFSTNLNLIILPTEKCNFRCAYCYEKYEKGEMTKETADCIIDYLHQNLYKYTSVNLDWFGGEPLCALDTVKDILYRTLQVSQKRSVPMISTMTTNGYLLTPELVRELLRLHVVAYQITLDGVKETHDKYRKLIGGGATFEEILKNLIDIKQKVKSGVLRFCIRVNITSHTLEYLNDFFDLLKQHFENDSRFELSLRYVRDLKGDGGIEDILNDDDIMLRVYSLASKKIPRLLQSHFLNMLNSSGTCYAGKPNSFVIGSDATIYKCTVHFDDPVNQIGCLKDCKLAIDEHKLSSWIYPNMYSQNECMTCWYRGACFDGTCPYKSIKQKNAMSCPFEKIHIEYILKFLDDHKFVEEIYDGN